MNTSNPNSLPSIEEFVRQFDTDEFRQLFRETGKFSEAEINEEIHNFCEQSVYGFQVVSPYLPSEPSKEFRILEVGAGSMVLSAYLGLMGFDVVPLEPVGVGFDFLLYFKAEVNRRYPFLKPLDKGAELLEAQDGQFDLIASVNVVEHLDDPLLALDQMVKRLKPGGKMMHSCPNYLIPYDPHFGIPLWPQGPERSGALFAKQIARNPGLWESVNFITSKTIAKHFGAQVQFKKGLLASAFNRLKTDPAYGSRHKTLLKLRLILAASGVLWLLGKLPGEYATPMEFVVQKQD